MFGAFVVELSEPPGLASFGLQGTPPDPGGTKPYRGFVESRGSGSPWFYTVLSEVTGKWEEIFGVVTDGTPLDTLTRVASLRSWNGSTLAANSPINWQPGDGTLKVFASPVADVQELLVADYRGTARPAWIQPGQRWRDSTGGPTSVVWKHWTGTLDIPLGTFNETTGVFSAAGNYVPIAGGVTVTGALTINGALTLNGTPSVNAANRIHATSMSVGGADFAPSSTIHTRGNVANAEAGTILIENQASNGFGIIRYRNGSRNFWAGITNTGEFQVYDDTAAASRLRISTGGDTVVNGLYPSHVADIGGLSGFSLFNNGSNSYLQYDANDGLLYDRANNTYNFYIGGGIVAQINSGGFVGMPMRKVSANAVNSASVQAAGLAVLLGNNPYHSFFMGRVRRLSTPGTITVRTLDSGGGILASVTTGSVGTNVDWVFWGYCMPAFAAVNKTIRVFGVNGGINEDLTATGANTNPVDQIQVLAAGNNVDATIAMWGAQ